ncbi:MAG: sulfotransferase [Planctomycetaceae bacterium]
MITIVSGLPRSGTSLMMQMLQAGGLPLLCDENRPADEHNPRGYLELQKVRSLEKDNSWVPDAEGKVVKVVSLLLYHLPAGFEYRVIFMRRDLDEVLRSQERMLEDLNQPGGPMRETMKQHFTKHLDSLAEWVTRQPHVRMIDCSYAELVTSPAATAQTVIDFLGVDLNLEQMIEAVDPALYRQRNER